MEIVDRPAVRVVCIDHQDRVLLLRWRDPMDGSCLWEPPGGGIEPGETALEAARRELEEETGLPGSTVTAHHVMVRRDVVWAGKRFVGEEAFFLARMQDPAPISHDGLREYETGIFQEHAWVSWSEIGSLADRVEPPELLEVLRALDGEGRWGPTDPIRSSEG
jgi:8-oxo-dGTP pyrophosphatase MutT (NUDIX family)